MVSPFEKPQVSEGSDKESEENSDSPFNTEENKILDGSFSPGQKEQASDELKKALIDAYRESNIEKGGSQFSFPEDEIEGVLKDLVPDETERKALTPDQKSQLIREEEMRIRASQDDNKNTKAA